MARRLQPELSAATLWLSELVQDKVILDPYLVLGYGDESVCLGTWEDGRIVACADRRF